MIHIMPIICISSCRIAVIYGLHPGINTLIVNIRFLGYNIPSLCFHCLNGRFIRNSPTSIVLCLVCDRNASLPFSCSHVRLSSLTLFGSHEILSGRHGLHHLLCLSHHHHHPPLSTSQSRTHTACMLVNESPFVCPRKPKNGRLVGVRLCASDYG